MDKTNELLAKIKNFRDERDWMQFHNHKDMAIAISIEASELLEHFLWKKESDELTEEQLAEIRDELADVFVYLLELSDNLGVDLISAAEEKIKKNESKYPVVKAKGKYTKYTKLQ